MNYNSLVAILIIVSTVVNAALAQSDLASNFTVQRQKIIKQLEEASKKGVGTKVYESVLSSIDQDIASGLPADQINKRLASLAHSIESQLNDAVILKRGLASASVSVSSAQAKEWGPYTSYMTAVQSKVRDLWQAPEQPTSHSMVVFFNIAKNGQISNLKISKSSGVPALDESILKAVKMANPFAALPSFCKEKAVDVEFTFDYNRYTKPSTTKLPSHNSVTSSPKDNKAFDMDSFIYVVRGGITAGDVTPDFLKEVKGYIDTMPHSLLAELQHRGARVCVVPRMADKLLGFSYEKPRGYDDGLTGKNADGLFDGTDVIVCEYIARPDDDLSLVRTKRTGYIVRHELGHACDRYWNNISATSEFKDIYLHEIASMDDDKRDGELAYFAQKTDAGPSECFAELFAIANGGGATSKISADLGQTFPKCTQLIRQKLGF